MLSIKKECSNDALIKHLVKTKKIGKTAKIILQIKTKNKANK